MLTSDKKHISKTKRIRTKKYAFNEMLFEVLLPRGVKVIGESAFYDCRNLKSAFLPDSLEIIEEDAFALCEALEEINLPDSLTELGERSFFWSGITKAVIPPEISKIKTSVFSNCRKLKEVAINAKCIEIGDGAFSNCMTLNSVTLPDSITKIGKECFKSCSELKSVKIPDGVKVLKCNTFENCSTLERIILPENLEEIESECFSGCCNLKTVVFPNKLKKIGEKAFYRCENLTEIRLPDNLEYLGNFAFAGCKNLTPLQIPDTLRYAGAALFGNCSVIAPQKTESMCVTSFLTESDCKNCPTVNIPESTKELMLGFNKILPYRYLTLGKSCFNHILAFKKYNAKVFVGESYYTSQGKILHNGVFDFSEYDGLFEKAEQHEKPLIASFRLAYPTELSDNRRDIYRNELFGHAENAAVFAVKINEERILQYLADNMDFGNSFYEDLYTLIAAEGRHNMLRILSAKRKNTGLSEINALFEELML